VSQLHRSPGVFLRRQQSHLLLGKIIPYRGSWWSSSTTRRTRSMFASIAAQVLGTIFLRALGLRSDEEILKTFYTVDRLHIADGKLQWRCSRT